MSRTPIKAGPTSSAAEIISDAATLSEHFREKESKFTHYSLCRLFTLNSVIFILMLQR